MSSNRGDIYHQRVKNVSLYLSRLCLEDTSTTQLLPDRYTWSGKGLNLRADSLQSLIPFSGIEPLFFKHPHYSYYSQVCNYYCTMS